MNINLEDFSVNPKPQGREQKLGPSMSLPIKWEALLGRTKSIATVRVAMFLLRQDWKCWGKPISISDKVAGSLGISVPAKVRALRELEQTEGLLATEDRLTKTPRYTVLR